MASQSFIVTSEAKRPNKNYDHFLNNRIPDHHKLQLIYFYKLQAGLGGNPLLPNSSEMPWNFQTPFYRKDSGTLRMVYVNFHKPICIRNFSMTIFLFSWAMANFCGGLPYGLPVSRLIFGTYSIVLYCWIVYSGHPIETTSFPSPQAIKQLTVMAPH